MKLLVYVSSGYFQRTDPDFRPEWATGPDLVEIYFDYAHCSPASPGWRAYLLPRLVRILDEYGVDGIYNDLGYAQPGGDPHAPPGRSPGLRGETPHTTGRWPISWQLIYEEVKRRGGIVKVHRGGATRPQTDLKVYDYLWVGEGGRTATVCARRSRTTPLRRPLPRHEPGDGGETRTNSTCTQSPTCSSRCSWRAGRLPASAP